MSVLHVKSITIADGTNSDIVRPSDWLSGHNQFVTLGGNTAGQSTISGTNIAFQGGNNVTLSAATAAGAATIIISGANTVAQTVQTQASGAIAGTGFTSTTTAGTAITAAMGTNGLSMAVPQFITTYVNDLTSGRAGTGFTSTTTTGTVVTAALGTNGLSMAVPAFITTYVNDLTSGRAGTGFTSTTTTGTAITAALGTNGLSMAVPAYITTYAAQTTQTQPAGNIAGVGTTLALTNITGTLNVGTNGVALSLSGNAAGGGGGAALQGSGTYTQNTGTIQFANGNGVTFGLSTNQMTASVKTDYAGTGFTSTTTAGTAITAALGTNGLTMAVPQFITTYVNDLTSGRAGTGFTSTTTAGTAITAALGTNGLSMAVPAYLTTYVAQTTQTQPAGNIAGVGTTLAVTNANATLSANTNGVALSLSVPDDDFNGWNLLGNTAGTTGTTITTQGAFYLQGGNNITLSGNSNTIVISAGAGGGTTNQTGPNIAVAGSTITAGTVLFSNANSVTFGMAGSTITASVGGFTASGYNHYNDVVQVAGQVGQGTLNFDPINLDFPVQFDRFGFPIAYTATTNSTGSQTISMRIGIYTNNAGTLSLLQSASTAVTAANSGTAGSYSLFSGVRLITIPFTTTLQPGDYWMGVLSSTSSSSQNGASISAMLQSNLGSNFAGFFGQSNNTTQQYTLGQGVYTTTTNAMPVSVAFSQIRGSDSNAARPPIVGWYSSTV